MQNEWDKLYSNLERRFFRKPGEHLLVGGITGSGKTQILYHIMDELLQRHPKETIIWFDTGKSGELLILPTLGKEKRRDIKIFVPGRNKIKINGIVDPENVYKFFDPEDILDNLEHDKINVISIEPYFQDHPDKYTKLLNQFFRALIRYANNGDLPIPLAVFIDEVHSIIPSAGSTYDEEHTKAAIRFERNIERLRSLEVRICGATQNWTKLRRGARTSFSWLIIKRGMTFTQHDIPQLAKYNEKWWQLKTEYCIWVYPERYFHNNYVKTPFYGDGKNLGAVRYEEVPSEENPHPVSQYIPSSRQELIAHH